MWSASAALSRTTAVNAPAPRRQRRRRSLPHVRVQRPRRQPALHLCRHRTLCPWSKQLAHCTADNAVQQRRQHTQYKLEQHGRYRQRPRICTEEHGGVCARRAGGFIRWQGAEVVAARREGYARALGGLLLGRPGGN